MTRVFGTLVPVVRWTARYPYLVLLLALGISALAANQARDLKVDPEFANLLPQDNPSVQALERVRAAVGGGETSVDVAIESPSFEANVRFAEALVPEVMALRDPETTELYFARVDLRRDTEFLEANALYLATYSELDDLEAYLEDQIVQARLEANPFYFALDDEEPEENDLDPIQQSYDYIVGSEYNVSEDSTILAVRFFTAGSASDIGYIERLYADLSERIEFLNPDLFHPELTTTLAGRLWRQRVEVRAVTDDVTGSLGVGALCVLLAIVGYFFAKRVGMRRDRTLRALGEEVLRAPIAAILIGLPLIMSLIWTAALASLVFGTLNIMTSALGLVLFGLGIDYGIHFYARYVEERCADDEVENALVRSFLGSGQAIAVGALTTAGALFILVFADFKGFSEFGVLAGTGVLLALVAMLIVMPALIVSLERFGLLTAGDTRDPGVPAHTGPFRYAGVILMGTAALVVFGLARSPAVEFEYRFGELEPTYEEWDSVHSKVSQAYYAGPRRNPAYIVLEDPNETAGVAAALQHVMEQDTALHVVDADSFRTTILSVESLEERFPLNARLQDEKLARIARIRDTLLTDPLLASRGDADLNRLRRAASTTEPLVVDDLPDDLRTKFSSKDGTLGGIVTIYPAVGLSDGRLSMAFAEDVGTVETADGRVYHAGSVSIVAAEMLRLMRREAPYMMLATFLIVACLMWINFASLRWTMLALVPLVVGIIWMLLLMAMLGMRLNFYNMVVLPAVIGIGNDAGAHIVHRYREEGPGSLLLVLRSTGEHVTVGALTTMIGFAGLLLSIHPGLQSIGALAIIGIATTLLAALVALAAAIQWIENRGERPGNNRGSTELGNDTGADV